MDHKIAWVPKNWCLWIVLVEKTLESPFDKIKPVIPKANQPWIFIGRIDAEAKAPIVWPLDVKSQLIGKALMHGKSEGKRSRGWQRIRWLDSITNSWNWANPRRWWRTGEPGMLQSTGSQRVRQTKLLNDNNSKLQIDFLVVECTNVQFYKFT